MTSVDAHKPLFECMGVIKAAKLTGDFSASLAHLPDTSHDVVPWRSLATQVFYQ